MKAFTVKYIIPSKKNGIEKVHHNQKNIHQLYFVLNAPKDGKSKDNTMNEDRYEIKILIECKVCERLIEKDEAHEVFTNEFVCDPDIDERCLGTWNKENYNPHDEL
jgi:hypothetical protein